MWGHGEGDQLEQLRVEPTQALTRTVFPQRMKSGWSLAPGVPVKAPGYDQILESRIWQVWQSEGLRQSGKPSPEWVSKS